MDSLLKTNLLTYAANLLKDDGIRPYCTNFALVTITVVRVWSAYTLVRTPSGCSVSPLLPGKLVAPLG